ncbi:S8 family peptidase [Nucisporomicrobium flavum]|uniref:S8 family peptidase n=1 Tax=Nucisporomicrobium flavum TaxID=2785915 RepID=UPI0018F6171D|nr:S8/S53 family peptidase [Nucisporomicrobium flavum]
MTIAAQWPLPDTRTPAQLEHDRQDVRGQVTVLETDGAAQESTLESIRARQVFAGRGRGLPFVRFTPNGSPRIVLAAENQLVVDADPQRLAQLGGLLAGYEPADRPGRSDRRRTRVLRYAQGRSAEALRADARRLRQAGVPANVNSIVPLGYVIKGSSYPGLTVAPRPFATNGANQPVRVAIVDTGMAPQPRTDAWDTGVVAKGTDPLNVIEPLDRNDWFSGHGTFGAGIVRQIAPDCEVVVYRFTAADGLGTDESAADMLIRAADDAAGKRLVINASFGAPAVDGVPPLAMQEAVAYISATYPDALIVASAGNDGRDLPLYPAAFPGVKAVGALTSDLTPASFSNRGSWVHCSTVGVGIVSTFVEGLLPPEPRIGTDVHFAPDAWATWSGTSFTAPQISAAVAALCGEDATLTPQAAFDQLIAGRPTVNGFGAVVHLLPGTPTS